MRDVYKFYWARECLDYNPDTGDLTWKHRDRWMLPTEPKLKQWNARFAGKVAGSAHGLGYTQICIKIYDKAYKVLAHRLAWYIHTGEIPVEIDHINGNRSDNRIVNLRPSNDAENAKNKAIAKNNKSGYPGVCYNQGKWEVRKGHNGKLIYIGSFTNKDDAIAACKKAERKYGYHKNHGRAA